MVEFMNLKLIRIQLQMCFSEGKFYTSNLIMASSLQSAHCQPLGCCAAAARWRPAATGGGEVATADVGCCALQCWKDVESLAST